MRKVKITVLRKTIIEDLAKEYGVEGLSKCPYIVSVSPLPFLIFVIISPTKSPKSVPRCPTTSQGVPACALNVIWAFSQGVPRK